jgi:hypothetical protein
MLSPTYFTIKQWLKDFWKNFPVKHEKKLKKSIGNILDRKKANVNPCEQVGHSVLHDSVDLGEVLEDTIQQLHMVHFFTIKKYNRNNLLKNDSKDLWFPDNY